MIPEEVLAEMRALDRQIGHYRVHKPTFDLLRISQLKLLQSGHFNDPELNVAAQQVASDAKYESIELAKRIAHLSNDKDFILNLYNNIKNIN